MEVDDSSLLLLQYPQHEIPIQKDASLEKQVLPFSEAFVLANLP